MEEKSENAKPEHGGLELSEEQKVQFDMATKPSLDSVDDDALLLVLDRIPLRKRPSGNDQQTLAAALLPVMGTGEIVADAMVFG